MAAPPDVPSTGGPSVAAPSPADPFAGVPIDPSKPIPTGDHEVEYAPWPADREESEERRRALDVLDDEIATLSAHVAAADYRLLVKIRAFDRWQGWHVQGFKSCAEWLSWRTHVTPGTARERVRVARALEHLPLLGDAMSRGELSYSVARALTRVATPENEERLVDLALVVPASDLERLVREWKKCQRTEEELRADEEARHQRRELWLRPAVDGGWRIHGRLDPEVGAALQKALEAAEERLYRSASPSEDSESSGGDADEASVGRAPTRETPRRARWADALGLVAEGALGKGLGGEEGNPVGRAERFQVVIRVTEETLRGEPLAVGDEPPEIEGGPHLSPETVLRLTCDCSTVEMTRDPKGDVLDVGRKSRRPPTAMRRALEDRDRRCRFPGCRSRYCDAHHIHHWTRGGPTALENLALLCWRHHRLVHEGGWRMERDGEAGGELRFYRPDGRELPAVAQRPPAPARPIRVMERAHRGLRIGPDTPTPDWDGLTMDVDLALEWLWGPGWALEPEDVRPDASKRGGDRRSAADASSRRDPSQRFASQRARNQRTEPDDASAEAPPLRDP